MSTTTIPIVFPHTREGIANLLQYDLKRLHFLLYVLPDDKQYKVFTVPKRDGTDRIIMSPISAIKTIQRRLADLLYDVYETKSCAYGFVRGRDVVLNAKKHVRKRWVVNIDLEDFFPTINFGRVRGAFMSNPFNCSEESATLLAQICCYRGILPQGAPTSPIVSNIICHQLDNRLLDFAKNYRLCYTRYADDISFSTNMKEVPKELGLVSDDGTFSLGEEIKTVINDTGFNVNLDKVHCCSRYNRQTVTGLITNEKVNVDRRFIKQIRCMIHAYERYGLKEAAREHFEKYDSRKTDYPELTFRKILVGKIGYLGHVRGRDDTYKRLVARMKAIDPSVPLTIPLFTGGEKVIVYGEGKTDGTHLRAAFQSFVNEGKYSDLSLTFYRYRDEDEVNNEKLYKACSSRGLRKDDDKIEIYLFDRDVPKWVNKVTNADGTPKYWGHGIYSMALPLVDHRKFSQLCIEHYYKDSDLLKEDDYGRRIYLSTEFDSTTMDHYSGKVKYFNMKQKDYLKAPYPRIIDSCVINNEGKNVAISKVSFANNIMQKKGNFASMDFSAFSVIFDLIKDISDGKFNSEIAAE